jgi:tetratricopeptide (TPR) repeat protein
MVPPPALPLRRRGAPPSKNGRGVKAAALFVLLAAGSTAHAQQGKLIDELLLRPQRRTAAGREEYEQGNHPKAVASFEAASTVRPADYRMKFNLADGLYKTGKYDEAATIFRALGAADSPLAAAARYNLGNSLYQRQDYAGAVRAYRDALTLQPDDQDARHNLELALRALEEQQRQQQEQQQPGEDQRDDRQQQLQQQQQQDDQQRSEQRRPGDQQQRPRTAEDKERERYLKETGMPKERAQQLLDALQEAEKAEQKKQLAALRAGKKKGKDW